MCLVLRSLRRKAQCPRCALSFQNLLTGDCALVCDGVTSHGGHGAEVHCVLASWAAARASFYKNKRPYILHQGTALAGMVGRVWQHLQWHICIDARALSLIFRLGSSRVPDLSCSGL